MWTQITVFITEFKKTFAGVGKLYWRKFKYIGLFLTPNVLIHGTAVYVRPETSNTFPSILPRTWRLKNKLTFSKCYINCKIVASLQRISSICASTCPGKLWVTRFRAQSKRIKLCHIRTRENVTYICAVLGWNHIFMVQLSNRLYDTFSSTFIWMLHCSHPTNIMNVI